MKQTIMKDFWIKLVLLIGTIAMIIGMCSCGPDYMIYKLQSKHPDKLADYAAKNYPATVGKPILITKTDTFNQIIYPNCDSLAATIITGNPSITKEDLIKLLKQYSLKTKNYIVTDSVFVPFLDSAKITSISLQLNALREDISTANLKAAEGRKQGKIMTWVAVSSGLLLIIIVALGLWIIIKTKVSVSGAIKSL